jgi:formylglycine-generating enzyme required for sulfatase activity
MRREIDPTGFPLVFVEPVGLWVQWLPVTKIQLEKFLCATGDARFDARWYSHLLDLNPRISPRKVRQGNYWQALLTGILPQEAESFARWLGEGYRLPSAGEWRQIYLAVKEPSQAQDLPSEALLADLPERSRDLLTHVEQAAAAERGAAADRSVADRMLLRGGVMEWVEDERNPQRWSGRGETPRRFHAALYVADDPEPARPNDPTTRRLQQYGFRLVRAES